MAKTYNFGNEQNYEIDLLFSHLLGQYLYFFDDYETKNTMFIVSLYPSLNLDIKFKFYTRDIKLSEQDHLLLGLDLNVDMIDTVFPKRRTDIIVCDLSLNQAICSDFYYDEAFDVYKANNDGKILNNLIPLGYSEIDWNILNESVINYNEYYYLTFQKEYPELFDNITMTNWINYVANDMNKEVTGFWRLYQPGKSYTFPNDFKLSEEFTYRQILFADGGGLDSKEKYIKFNILLLICIFLCFI